MTDIYLSQESDLRVSKVIGPFNSPELYLQKAKQSTSRAALENLPHGYLHRVLHRYFRPLASMWRVFIADKDWTGRVPAPTWYRGHNQSYARFIGDRQDGADMPLILRSFGVFYEIVGAAYVHGVMTHN